MNTRTRRSEPEPVAAREEGYYWIFELPIEEGDEPDIRYYGASTMRDQDGPIWDSNGKPIENRIIYGYFWYDGNPENDSLDDSRVFVASEKLVPPKVK